MARSQHVAPGRRPCPTYCNKLRAPCATDAKGLPNPHRPRAVEEYLPGLGLGVGRRALPILSFRRGRSLSAFGVSLWVQALAPAIRALGWVVVKADRVGTGGFLEYVSDGAASAATAADISAGVAAGTADGPPAASGAGTIPLRLQAGRESAANALGGAGPEGLSEPRHTWLCITIIAFVFGLRAGERRSARA